MTRNITRPVSLGTWLTVAACWLFGFIVLALPLPEPWHGTQAAIGFTTEGMALAAFGICMNLRAAGRSGALIEEEVEMMCPGCGNVETRTKVSLILLGGCK